jgi:hypothetical protein
MYDEAGLNAAQIVTTAIEALGRGTHAAPMRA